MNYNASFYSILTIQSFVAMDKGGVIVKHWDLMLNRFCFFFFWLWFSMYLTLFFYLLGCIALFVARVDCIVHI